MKEEKTKETLGQRLKSAREAKELTLEEASKKTKLHINVLSAIEGDRIETITNSFYAKAFIKSYAQFLGLSEDELVRGFISGAKKPAKQVLFLEGKKEREAFDIIGILKFFSVVLVSIILLLSVLTFAKSFAKKQKTAKPKKVASKTVAQTKEVKKATPAKESTVVKEGLILIIFAKEDTWLQLKRDGKIIFKGVLAKDKKETWKAKDRFELWVGNAGGVVLNLNGKELSSPGKKGEIIKNIVITKEGMKVK